MAEARRPGKEHRQEKRIYEDRERGWCMGKTRGDWASWDGVRRCTG